MAAIKQIKVDGVAYDIKAKLDIDGNDITTTYVKKDGNKVLSDENFSSSDKSKLDSIPDIDELATKSELIGKVDSSSDGTGEIFNDYENNKATGTYSHASGFMCESSGDFSFSHGRYLISSGISSVAFNGNATNIYLDGEAGAIKYEFGKTSGWLKSNLPKKELVNYFKQDGIRIGSYDSPSSSIIRILDHKIVDVVYEEDGDKLFLIFDKTLSSSEALVNKLYGIVRNIGSGNFSYCEGTSNVVRNSNSHIEGNDNTELKTSVGGTSNHIEGFLNICYEKADGAHIEGSCNEVRNSSEHAQGNYNKSNIGSTKDLKTIHSIGVGTKTKRMNAQEVMKNGDHYILGVGDYDGTNPSEAKTLLEVISSKVDKDGSKVLSDQNFTTELKNKLDGIDANANDYTHPTGAGNNHIPAGGSSGLILKWSAAGTATWGAEKSYSEATTGAAGLMSASDKTKLDGLKNYVLPAAGTSIGGVKKGVAVANVDTGGELELTVDTVAAKINELLASLRNAGVIATE